MLHSYKDLCDRHLYINFSKANLKVKAYLTKEKMVFIIDIIIRYLNRRFKNHFQMKNPLLTQRECLSQQSAQKLIFHIYFTQCFVDLVSPI